MATKAAKKVKESFKVVKKRNGRWSVKGNNGKFINGEEKVKILAAHAQYLSDAEAQQMSQAHNRIKQGWPCCSDMVGP